MKFKDYLINILNDDLDENVRLPGLGRPGINMPKRSTPGSGFGGKRKSRIEEPSDEENIDATDPVSIALKKAFDNYAKGLKELENKLEQ